MHSNEYKNVWYWLNNFEISVKFEEFREKKTADDSQNVKDFKNLKLYLESP